MSSRTRGEKTKGDIANDGILKRIPTRALVRNCRQAIYYDLLASVKFAELDGLSQAIAILFAQTFCTILDILDTTNVKNDADIRLKIAQQSDLGGKYNQLLQFYRHLQQNAPKEKTDKQPESNAIPVELDLQQLLSNLDNEDA